MKTLSHLLLFLKNPLLRVIELISTLSILGQTAAFSQSVSATYGLGDIPTSLGRYDPSCNGSSTILSVPLPMGGPWRVDSISISYLMAAQGDGLGSHQRSIVRCQNTDQTESSVTYGSGGAGNHLYTRTGVDIANNIYPGGATIQFEMRAWRTNLGTDCSTTYNRINNFSWTITVYYSEFSSSAIGGSVGVGTIEPAEGAAMDVFSDRQAFLPPRFTIAQRNNIDDPVPGMIIFNTTTQKINVYTESGWDDLNGTNTPLNSLLGGSGAENWARISPTNDGGYIICATSNSNNSGTLSGLINHGGSDIWILKLDESANLKWQKLYGGAGAEWCYSIQQTYDGGYIAAGYSASSNTGDLTGYTSHGGDDGWILKLNQFGDITWQKLLGGSLSDQFRSIQQTDDGGYIVAGQSSSSNSGTLAGIMNHGTVPPTNDYWILKLDSLGETSWQKLLGGSQSDVAKDIRQTPDGGYIVIGESASSNSGDLSDLLNNGSSDWWVVKLDSTGGIQWKKLMGGQDADVANGIRATKDGGYILIGHIGTGNANGTLTGLTRHGSSDIWIVKLNPSGDLEWQKLYGGAQIENGNWIEETSDGGFIMSGASNSSNTGTLTGQTNFGSYDYMVMKLDVAGHTQWAKLYGGSLGDQSTGICQTSHGEYVVVGYSTSSNSGTLTGVFGHGSNSDMWVLKIDNKGKVVK